MRRSKPLFYRFTQFFVARIDRFVSSSSESFILRCKNTNTRALSPPISVGGTCIKPECASYVVTAVLLNEYRRSNKYIALGCRIISPSSNRA